ncbi:MAG TPA: hypothetical protein VFS75_00500 [Candidatus Paceibacterota bacterium]|nr:hypothetical protein [Candidatus Paceibacterota bacterium]
MPDDPRRRWEQKRWIRDCVIYYLEEDGIYRDGDGNQLPKREDVVDFPEIIEFFH